MNNTFQHEPTPPDLLTTEATLSRLAAAERASARTGFEDRLLAATAAQFGGASEERQSDVIGVIAPEPTRVWRLAASIAVVATGVLGATWLATRGPSPTTPQAIVAELNDLESDLQLVNTELATLGLPDQSSDSMLSDEASTLEAELAALESELTEYEWDDSFNGVTEDSL